MFKYTLVNTFHNTKVSFFMSESYETSWHAYVELNQLTNSIWDRQTFEYKKLRGKLNRINRALCGGSACHCGGMIQSA